MVNPRLIQDAGKEGVAALTGILYQLSQQVVWAQVQGFNGGKQAPSSVLPGYRTARVQRELGELAKALNQAYGLCSVISAPLIQS